MEGLTVCIEYVRETGLLGLLLPPFLIWALGEVLWVGFFFPAVEALRDRVEKGNQIENRWKYVWNLGLRRALDYKWEIFFASLSGIVILDIYWLILELADKFLSSLLYTIVLAASGFLYIGLLFSKGSGIMSKPPSSSMKSIRYLWRGFINPFNKDKASKVQEVSKKVNAKLKDSCV